MGLPYARQRSEEDVEMKRRECSENYIMISDVIRRVKPKTIYAFVKKNVLNYNQTGYTYAT